MVFKKKKRPHDADDVYDACYRCLVEPLVYFSKAFLIDVNDSGWGGGGGCNDHH